MENKSHALAAGAFVLLLSALLAAMAVWLMRDSSEQRVFEISSRDAVTGLQPQAGVRYKGVLVGRVAAIELDRQVPGQVSVRIAVNESVPVGVNTFASLGFQGVTGLAFVQLDDNGESGAALPANGKQAARIPMRPGLVSRITEQGAHLLGQLDQASQKLNALLAADNQKTLMAAVTQLGQAAASMEKLGRRLDLAVQGDAAPGALNLPQLAVQAQTTLQSMQATAERLNVSAEAVRNSATEFRRLSLRMNEPGGTLDRIARSTDALSATSQAANAQLLPRLNRTTEDAARTVRKLGTLIDGVADNPQSLLLGKTAARPGPGEPGFVAPGMAVFPTLAQPATAPMALTPGLPATPAVPVTATTTVLP